MNQCLGLIFAESDSYPSCRPFVGRIFNRRRATSFNPRGNFYFITDRCCADLAFFRELWNNQGNSGQQLFVKLDPFHLLQRMFHNKTLRLTGHADAAARRHTSSTASVVLRMLRKVSPLITFRAKNNLPRVSRSSWKCGRKCLFFKRPC